MEILINNILKYARFLRDIKYKFTKKIFLTSHGFSMWFHKEPQSKDIIPKIETDIIKKIFKILICLLILEHLLDFSQYIQII